MIATRLRYRVAYRLRRRRRVADAVLSLVRAVPVRVVRVTLGRSFSWLVLDPPARSMEIATTAGKIVVDTGDTIGRVLAASGEWEAHVTHEFRRSLSAGDVCVDVGAHIGYYTLVASKLVGPHGNVFAIEASPRVYRTLTANLARNDAANVIALNVAAGAAEGTADLYEAAGESPGTSSLSPRILDSPHVGRAEDYRSAEVDVATIDSLVPRDLHARVRVVKIDVEGYEVEALRGLERIVGEGAPLALFVELSPEWSEEEPAPYVEDLCRRHGFRPFRLVNEYSFEGYFPARIVPPIPLDAIPAERCDLLLRRPAEAA
jgi:FkbM family methyltransferase